jgi:PAS domain S-box-containing protein
MSGKNNSSDRAREVLTRLADVKLSWANPSISSSVRVGILHSLEATPLLEATLMAIAQLNQTGGLLGREIEPIAIENLDDLQAILQTPSIDTLFGSWTSANLKAIFPLLEAYNALLWSSAPYEGLESCDPAGRVFYTGPCPNQPVEFLVPWLLQQQKRCIYLLGSDELFSKTTHHLLKKEIAAQNPLFPTNQNSLLTQLDRQGGIVVGEDYLDPQTTDFSDAIARIQHRVPDLVISTLNRNNQIAFYTQLQQAGFSASHIPILAFNLSELELQSLGEAALGHYSISSYFHSLEWPENCQFVADFQHHCGEERVTSAAIAAAYTQVYLWKQAVELAESFAVERVRAAAYSQRFLAPNGLVTLETNHHLSQPYYIGRVVDRGQIEVVASSDRPLKPLPWLGVEVEKFNPSDVLVEVLSDVSLWVRRSHDFEKKNRELQAEIAQLQSEIASRQHMEEAMRNYGLKLRALFAAIGDAIFVTDVRGVFLNIAPTNPQNPYKPTADLLGKCLHDVFEPAQADIFLDYLRSALETGQTIAFEYCQKGKVLHPKSKEVWFSVSLSPILQDESVVWLLREITQQKQVEYTKEAAKRELEQQFAERTAALVDSNEQLIAEIVQHRQTVDTLQATQEQLQAILGAVPGIVSWISSDLRYLGVNRHLAETFGLPVETFLGQPIGFLQASSEFDEFVRDFFASPLQENSQEISAYTQNELRNYLIVAQKYNDGRAAFTIGIDITDRVQAIEGLRATKDQLETVLEAVPGIVSWISSDLHYLGVNRHLSNTFSLPPEQFAGKPIGFLQVSSEFDEFVRDFFESPLQEASQEISACVNGVLNHYLIVAQKYDEGRAAFTIGIDISARVRALEGLRRAEENYRAIFEHTVEGIFQTTLDGCYLSANPALARIYGYESPEQLMAELGCIERQLYVDRQRRQQFIQRVQERGSVVGFESQIYRRDGTLTWISENARVVRDRGGNILYYEGTVEDILERKQAEEKLRQLNEELEIRVEERTNELQQLNLQLLLEIAERERIELALRQSEAELKALFAAMTDAISIFDAAGRYVKIVTTTSELLYSPTGDRVGKTVYEIFPPETADLFMRHIQQVLQTGQTAHIEYCLTLEKSNDWNNPKSQISNPKSQEVWFAASISPLPDDCVIWVARNITERRRVLKAVQEAEEKYRSIFENAAEGIFQSTPEGYYLSANPALVRMYGYDSFADLAANVTQIGKKLYVNPQQREVLLQRVEREGAVSGFQVQVYRKDCQRIWVSENVRVVRDEQGKTLYYEGTVQDITQRKLTEDALHLEREKSERLLLNILPKRIADRLKQEPQAIAERFEQVSILFADIVGFTELSARTSPTELVEMLNQIFSAFDRLAQQYELEKIKTIGDAYMVAGGFSRETCCKDRYGAIADMALAMQRQIQHFQQDNGQPFRLRIGINSGPVVAGVIGMNKFIYDLWGDTVNIASRMESHGLPGKIQVTAQTYDLLKERYRFEQRGSIEVKGRGEMMTYWLMGKRVAIGEK